MYCSKDVSLASSLCRYGTRRRELLFLFISFYQSVKLVFSTMYYIRIVYLKKP